MFVTMLTGAMALGFFAAGAAKLTGDAQMVATFGRFGLGDGWRLVIGVAEVVGAVGLLIPRVASLAAAGLAAITASAVVFHLMHDPPQAAIAAGCLCVASVFLAWTRRFELAGGDTPPG